jgi:hypothetical protein
MGLPSPGRPSSGSPKLYAVEKDARYSSPEERVALRREGGVEMTRTALEGSGRKLEKTDEVVIEVTARQNRRRFSRCQTGGRPGEQNLLLVERSDFRLPVVIATS